MTRQEYEAWLNETEASAYKWTEDVIFRLNGRGAFFYRGGVDGQFVEVASNGLLEIGTYEGAIPHIGEACFRTHASKQFPSFDKAYTATLQFGGMSFLVDILCKF